MSFILGGALSGLGRGLQELQSRVDEARDRAEQLLREKQDDLARAAAGGGGGGGGQGGNTTSAAGDRSRREPISRGMTGSIRSMLEDQGADEETINRFIAETEVLRGQGMTENQAWERAQRAAERDAEGFFTGRFIHDGAAPRYGGDANAAIGTAPRGATSVQDLAAPPAAPAEPARPSFAETFFDMGQDRISGRLSGSQPAAPSGPSATSGPSAPSGFQVPPQTPAGPGVSVGSVAAPTSQAEYDALPSGTRYRDPEGNMRTKP